MITCPACKGNGFVYYNEDGERISLEQFVKLPRSKCESEQCAECNGSGEVEYDDEPDYDSMPGGPDYY